MFDLSPKNIVKGKKTTAAGVILGALGVYLAATTKASLAEVTPLFFLALYLLGVADPSKTEQKN